MIDTFKKLQTFINNGLMDEDDIGETLLLVLMNVVSVSLGEDRPWKQLEDEDSSKTVASGDTYLTMKGLPDDFSSAGKYIYVGDSDGSSIVRYVQVGFKLRRRYKDSARLWYIDHANNKFALTGSGNGLAGRTIFLPYQKRVQEITTSQLWNFPDRFTPLIGFMVAEMHKGGVDYDSVTARQLIQNRKDATVLFDAMVAWDSKLVYDSIGGSYAGADEASDADGLPVGDGVPSINLGDM